MIFRNSAYWQFLLKKVGKFDVDEILARDKTSLDIFWIKDKSLADLDNLPSPDVLADDIIENLQSALESFAELKAQLNRS